MINDLWSYISVADHWWGPTGILARLDEHLRYSAIAVGISLVLAVPLGLLVGHTGRGIAVVTALANAFRALPAVGLLIFLVVLISPQFTGRSEARYLIPTTIVLVLLSIPSILANTVEGIRNVDPEARDAASGMGMTGSQVLFKVELPCALPLIFSGVRSAVLQVIATATIAAYISLGGLGRLIIDGLSSREYPKVITGAVLVAVLAIVMDLLIALIQRYTVSRGVSGRFSTRSAASTPRKDDALEADAEVATV